MDPVITVDHVVKRFGDYVAVHDANFEIARGEFFSMLGPSGCGKTTTLRMIAGFEQPTTGRILLEGKDVSRVPPYRRNVNTVFQHYALFPHMSVYDNVAFGPRSRKIDESRREEAGRGTARGRPPAEVRHPQADPALRRPAAAGGAGEGAGQLSQRAPPRRAAGRPRPEAAAGDADRAEADSARSGNHLHLRDPRSGRGPHDVGPHRGHERGQGRADRLARGDLSHPELGLRRQFHRSGEPASRHGPLQFRKRRHRAWSAATGWCKSTPASASGRWEMRRPS